MARFLPSFFLSLSAAIVGALLVIWYLREWPSPVIAAAPETVLLAASPVTEHPASTHNNSSTPEPVASTDAPTVNTMTVEDQTPLLLTLQEALLAEQQAREVLTEDLQRLRLTVQRLERQLAETRSDDAPSETPAQDETPRRPDVPSLVAVGFPPEDAEQLVWRWGEQQMAELYLRDQARREGWQNTPRYREALNGLRHGEGSLRDEMSEADYEAMLYAMGQPNRLVIRQVVPASPAQLAGLQAGDQLLDYNGTRIFDYRELRQHIADGDPEELVPVRIARGMQTLEVFLPRGPLGVNLAADSVAPDS